MYELIPKEIQSMIRWVCCWKGYKMPMMATDNTPASTSRPDTWCDFDTAVSAVEDGYYDGIGFVFNSDGYVGIDIDIGYTDGAMTDIARSIIDKCGSYTEKSRSGRGMHILLKGDLPFLGRNNRQGIEIYKGGRYFICTGDRISGTGIVENQSAIDWVVEQFFADVKEERVKGSPKIYQPLWSKRSDGKVSLSFDYPPIGEGGRNLSLLSLGGMLANAGWSKRSIYLELLRCNNRACVPPLSGREIQSIVRSVCKYKR